MPIRVVGVVDDGSRGCGPRRRQHRRLSLPRLASVLCLDSRCLELGGTVVWEGGHWARPPYRVVEWMPHRYAYRNGVHVFIRGGWRDNFNTGL
jgi:hypothetical protein